ncbi:DUF4242 domain-containing protein [Gordonia humi]|uniref:DUF4242 domain-containing protein n=1 Tax=Gordonia humi TaxID=686429 RepID=A0A840ETU2_9ACTN|nr:DUF4242 domain-containing protein [Gordonia humi]MBB4133693.1 hypothetical protein [Gordonia humi]
MALYLHEITPAVREPGEVEALIKSVDTVVRDAGGSLIETQVTEGAAKLFVITEFSDSQAANTADLATLEATAVVGPDEVRLVGAELDQVKAARPTAGYLVEWDIPAEIDMDTYFARKKANAPKYADVPEVSFLRTYVREDTDKCLCFYDAPDEAAVLRARDAVSTPVDRLHRLQG